MLRKFLPHFGQVHIVVTPALFMSEYLIHLFSLGQLVDQLVQITDLPHEGIF